MQSTRDSKHRYTLWHTQHTHTNTSYAHTHTCTEFTEKFLKSNHIDYAGKDESEAKAKQKRLIEQEQSDSLRSVIDEQFRNDLEKEQAYDVNSTINTMRSDRLILFFADGLKRKSKTIWQTVFFYSPWFQVSERHNNQNA